jgi:hypothetical protein
MLLHLIGEQLGPFLHQNDEIYGISISMRKQESVLVLWNKDSALVDLEQIRICLRTIVPDIPIKSIDAKVHRLESQ